MKLKKKAINLGLLKIHFNFDLVGVYVPGGERFIIISRATCTSRQLLWSQEKREKLRITYVKSVKRIHIFPHGML